MVDRSPEKRSTRVLAVLLSVFGAVLGYVYYSGGLESGFALVSLRCSYFILSALGFALFLNSRCNRYAFWSVTMLLMAIVFSLLILVFAGITHDGYNVLEQFLSNHALTLPYAVLFTQALGGIYSLLEP